MPNKHPNQTIMVSKPQVTLLISFIVICQIVCPTHSLSQNCLVDDCTKCANPITNTCLECSNTFILRHIKTQFGDAKYFSMCVSKESNGLYILGVFVPILILFGVYLYCSLLDPRFEEIYALKVEQLSKLEEGTQMQLKDFGGDEYRQLLAAQDTSSASDEEEVEDSNSLVQEDSMKEESVSDFSISIE